MHEVSASGSIRWSVRQYLRPRTGTYLPAPRSSESLRQEPKEGVGIVDLSGAVWRKSTLSNVNGCVEVAFVAGQIAVRDSKDRQGPVLVFTAPEWAAFLGGVRNGEFDLG
jgi:hypothetical protein